MSEVRLVVRDSTRDLSGTIHGASADRAIAALAADPVTLEELEAAVARFEKAAPGDRFFAWFSPGLCDEPYDAGLVVIDLAARLIVVDSSYSSPAADGTVHYHDGKHGAGVELPYRLADDWLFTSDRLGWQHVAEQRRSERAAQPALDARAVFYGRPLLEFIAREVWAAFARRDEIAAAARARWAEEEKLRLADRGLATDVAFDDAAAGEPSEEKVAAQTWPGLESNQSPYYDAIKDIHAAWLLAPREDLGGASPREIAVERREHITFDIQHRATQWSLVGECPPGLDATSYAYQYGGFGIHELVKYYDLVRELLWSCWERLEQETQSPQATLGLTWFTVGDFLAAEVPRLEKVRDAWLDAPDADCLGRTPRSVIERERARLPEGISGREAMIDPDCPCCQMAADLPGPAFWHLDGSAMDQEWVFDFYYRTRDEWDAEQRRWEEFNRRFEAERAERVRLGMPEFGSGGDSESIWSRSFVLDDAGAVPLGVRIFGIGCRLAELITRLRDGAEREATAPAVQRQIDQLNRDFGNLREILQSPDAMLADALLEPVLERGKETLAAVAAERDDLAEQCERLSDEFRRLLEPPGPEPDWGPEDLDIPF